MCGSADPMGLGISPRFVDARLAAVLRLMGRSALRQNEVLACGERDRCGHSFFVWIKYSKFAGSKYLKLVVVTSRKEPKSKFKEGICTISLHGERCGLLKILYCKKKERRAFGISFTVTPASHRSTSTRFG